MLKVKHQEPSLILPDYGQHVEVDVGGRERGVHSFLIDSLNLLPEGNDGLVYDRISMDARIRHLLNCSTLHTLIASLMDTIEEEQRTLNGVTSFVEHNECDGDVRALVHEYVLVQNEYITRLRKIRIGAVFATKHAYHLERKLERHAKRIRRKSNDNAIEF